MSEQLCGYVDIMPTLCAAAGVTATPAKKWDGINFLPSLTGKKTISRELFLGHGSIIVDDWKLVKTNSGNEKMKHTEDVLFNIVKDPEEKNNLRNENPGKYQQLLNAVKVYDNISTIKCRLTARAVKLLKHLMSGIF